MTTRPPPAERLTFARAFTLDFAPGTSISFVNLASLYPVLAVPAAQRRDFVWYGDGFLLLGLLRLLTGGRLPRLPRVSFDYTSIAPAVFAHCQDAGLPLYLVGARAEELAAFVAKLRAHYPGLRVVGAHPGYFPAQDWTTTCQAIAASPARVLLVGLGGGLQERFIAAARAHGFTGTALTCGGFIRQTAGSAALRYYPDWINRLQLRFLYRMVQEPHTVRRYLLDYPRHALRLARDLLAGRLVIDVVGAPAAPPRRAPWTPAPDPGGR